MKLVNGTERNCVRESDRAIERDAWLENELRRDEEQKNRATTAKAIQELFK